LEDKSKAGEWEKYKWLNNIHYYPKYKALKQLETAFIRFIRGVSRFPKYKKKGGKDESFALKPESFEYYLNGYVNIPGIGRVKLSEKNRIPRQQCYENIRVTYDGINFYLCLSILTNFENVRKTFRSVGIDLGITKTLVTSSGYEEPNINHISKRIKKLEKRKRTLQRKVSKKYEMNKQGKKYIKTKNILKLEKEIRKIYRSLTNIRHDFRHKITTKVVRTKPYCIVVENLNIRGMMKNKYLAKSIQEQAFYEIKSMLSYKSYRAGINFIEAPRNYPSTRKCSNCGEINHNMKLSDRIYRCPKCQLEIDRDLNAAKNLRNYISIKKGSLSI
jgi:putative transposase